MGNLARKLVLRAAALGALVTLAACSDPEATARYMIDAPTPQARVGNSLGTAELRDISLPEYASGQEVAWQTADGAIRSNPEQLWADNPQRSMTISLARAISEVSGATVIPEPWPLAEPPARKLEVRVEKSLAQADGLFRLSGRYFVSNDSAGGTNYARDFDISVPMTTDESGEVAPGAVAQALSTAITQLAGQIATLSGPGATIRTSAPEPSDPFAIF